MHLCLAYPELTSSDQDLIDEFRRSHDQMYVDVVEPHWTMVFPLRDLSENELSHHLVQVAEKTAPIEFVCRYAMVHDDDEKDIYYIFLVPDEGFSEICRLHDDLYTGFLSPYLRLDLPYVPHIGIATNKDVKLLRKLADSWNQKRHEIHGKISSISLSQYDGKTVTDLQQYDLTGS